MTWNNGGEFTFSPPPRERLYAFGQRSRNWRSRGAISGTLSCGPSFQRHSPWPEDETFNCWTIGAGVDYPFTDNVFGRVEYRYNDFGDKDIAGVNVDLDQNVVKVGIGVKF